MNEQREPLSGMLLDSEVSFSLFEICRTCDVTTVWIMELVQEGVLEPRGRHPQEWRFPGEAVKRVQTARRLTEDLRINLPGVALALDLLDELAEFRGGGGYGV